MPRTTQPPHRYTFASGARPLDGFTIKRAIGRGGFGEVYYATSDAGKEVALKLITRNGEVERRGVVQCMNLKSPHLIAVHDIRTNDEGDSFVVMEYVAGPSLANVLAQHPEGLPPAEVRAWLKGLVEGVAYLHDHGIVHRDLKPANLFMEEGVVKIGDYGLSKLINQSQGPGNSESIGTCHYMAPEISTGKYHKPIDIYALGVILYEMLTGRVPFDGESAQEILMKHLTARPGHVEAPGAVSGDRREGTREGPEPPPGQPLRAPAGGRRAEGAPGPLPRRGEGWAARRGSTFEDERPREDVLRIEAEAAPVFYIGPGTWPTRRRGRATEAAPSPRAAAPRRAPAVAPPPRRAARPSSPPGAASAPARRSGRRRPCRAAGSAWRNWRPR